MQNVHLYQFYLRYNPGKEHPLLVVPEEYHDDNFKRMIINLNLEEKDPQVYVDKQILIRFLQSHFRYDDNLLFKVPEDIKSGWEKNIPLFIEVEVDDEYFFTYRDFPETFDPEKHIVKSIQLIDIYTLHHREVKTILGY